MTRYIDADNFRNTMIKRFGCIPCLTDYSEASRYDIPIDDALNLVPAADVVPKSEVACELVGLYEKCASKIPHHIRRIFKDDRNFEDGFREGKTDALIEVLVLIAKLKKKYTEGGTECQ